MHSMVTSPAHWMVSTRRSHCRTASGVARPTLRVIHGLMSYATEKLVGGHIRSLVMVEVYGLLLGEESAEGDACRMGL